MSTDDSGDMAPAELTNEDALENLSDEQTGRYMASVFGSLFAGQEALDPNRLLTQQNIRELSEGGDIEFKQGLPQSDNHHHGESHENLKAYADEIDIGYIEEVSTEIDKLREALETFAEDLHNAIDRSKDTWQGAAADEAHGYFSRLQTWAQQYARNAELTSEVINEQAHAAQDVKNMPDPVPFNMHDELQEWKDDPFNAIFGGKMAEAADKYEESRDAHEEAAEKMTAYDQQLQGSSARQPVFIKPPKRGEDETTAASAASGMSGPAGPAGAGGGVGAPGGAGGGAPAPTGGGPAGGGSGGGGEPMPGRDTGAGVAPGANRPGGPNAPGGPRPGQGPSGSDGMGRGGMGAVPVGGAGAAGGGGGGAAGGGRPGAGGGRGGGFGPGSGGRSAAAPMGQGGAGGTAAGGAGAAAAAGRGGGMGGGGAMGGAGGGRGGQDDESEHQRPSFLVEADPDDIFGTTERTAPPVIGE